MVVTVSTRTSSPVLQAIDHMIEADQAWLRMRVLSQVWQLREEFLSSWMEVEGLPVEMGGVASSGGSVAWLYW